MSSLTGFNMKTSFPTLRSSARQHAEAQFAGTRYRPDERLQNTPAAGLATWHDAYELADRQETVRRGLLGFVRRSEILEQPEL
jgi:hypothetical protein